AERGGEVSHAEFVGPHQRMQEPQAGVVPQHLEDCRQPARLDGRQEGPVFQGGLSVASGRASSLRVHRSLPSWLNYYTMKLNRASQVLSALVLSALLPGVSTSNSPAVPARRRRNSPRRG